MFRTLALSILGTLWLLCGVSAATILVVPGPGTPVQDAIDAAAPGDTIKLAGGSYAESVTITKPLRLVGPSHTWLSGEPQPAAIVPGCGGSTTGVTVAADHVTIRDLRVASFTDYGIDVTGRNRVSVRNVLVAPNCGNDAPLASINVEGSTRVKVEQGWVSGFADDDGPALRLKSIPAGGKVRVHRIFAGRHAIGFLVEDCAPGSVTLSANSANFNFATGILARNADGILLKKNVVSENPVSGIELDAVSEGNRLVANAISGSATDVIDAGTGNCWKNNTFSTGSVPPCP